ncbi:MAG: hypothetical protein L3J74_18260, partial [Bacteroidales bacterium]|nr:hypothetical protein [Bacteroidales bacterium]
MMDLIETGILHRQDKSGSGDGMHAMQDSAQSENLPHPGKLQGKRLTLSSLVFLVSLLLLPASAFATAGVNWTARVSGITTPLSDVAWSPSLNLFVAVGQGGILTSP